MYRNTVRNTTPAKFTLNCLFTAFKFSKKKQNQREFENWKTVDII